MASGSLCTRGARARAGVARAPSVRGEPIQTMRPLTGGLTAAMLAASAHASERARPVGRLQGCDLVVVQHDVERGQ